MTYNKIKAMNTNVFSRTTLTQNADFPETTAFKRYAVKTSEKANMYIETEPTEVCKVFHHLHLLFQALIAAGHGPDVIGVMRLY